MLGRSVVVWLAVLVLAFVNGGVREVLLIPAIGAFAGRAISAIALSLVVLLVTYLTIRWVGPRSPRDAWIIGALWLALTLAFELLTGHFAFGTPWPDLFADYDVFHGRLWPLVLVTVAVAPRLCTSRHGIFGSLT
ncbi:MAG: hypothetical protein IT184_17045 [Acidobacteria bacterium]|nr:hypothetical protein [Acidobacteriota bacterium]